MDDEIHKQAMDRYYAQQRTVDSMEPEERAWYDGFASALLFVQAAYDVEGGMQTIKTHMPDERWDREKREWIKEPNFKEKLEAIVRDIDDEGGIVSMRFLKEEVYYGQTKSEVEMVEIGCSEGHHGVPEWD